MTFRARLTIALVALAVVPLLVLGIGVRREMRARLDADAARRVDAAATALTARLTATLESQQRRLESFATELAADNRFRSALADGTSADRRWLIDWASATMPSAGFAVLAVQDSTGRILSAGHFRNDFDRVTRVIPGANASVSQQRAVVVARTPTGPVRALVTTAAFTARGARLTVTGGAAFDSTHVAALSSDPMIAALLVLDGAPAPEGAVLVVTLPYAHDDATAEEIPARLVLVPDTGPTLALKAGVTRWLLITLGGTLLAAVVVAGLLGRVISAPLVALSDRTARLDLDRLDQRFATTGRDDEFGALERTLDALTGRLRTSVARLREAERAAATGDVARQVNHDIKNGLAPIRNVLRHLAQTAERDPDALAAIFLERRGTLESSVEYLDALARNYARLSPTLTHGPTDPRPVVLNVARGVAPAQVDVRLPDALPPVRADAVVLHRILDNLVSNAVDALEGRSGTVTVSAEAVDDTDGARVRFTVADTGRGMTREELARAFDDFHTTKPSGTGLGLSVVRRLLTDIGGSVRADTAPGEGTTFTVEVPAARFQRS
jgi:signal transduction histidine kinase